MTSFPAKVIGLAAAMIAAVAWLQHSLVLVHHLSAWVHWAAVLGGVPLLAGVAARLLAPRRPYVLSFAAGVLATLVLYVLYAHFFWRAQPTPVQAVAFFGALALSSVFGVTLAGGRRMRMKAAPPRKVALFAYHALAIVAAVVTIIGFMREG